VFFFGGLNEKKFIMEPENKEEKKACSKVDCTKEVVENTEFCKDHQEERSGVN